MSSRWGSCPSGGCTRPSSSRLTRPSPEVGRGAAAVLPARLVQQGFRAGVGGVLRLGRGVVGLDGHPTEPSPGRPSTVAGATATCSRWTTSTSGSTASTSGSGWTKIGCARWWWSGSARTGRSWSRSPPDTGSPPSRGPICCATPAAGGCAPRCCPSATALWALGGAARGAPRHSRTARLVAQGRQRARLPAEVRPAVERPSPNRRISLRLELLVVNRGVWQFPVKRLAVVNAAAQETWPRRHSHMGLDTLRQQTPELGMVPTKVVAGTVSVSANARTEPLHLGDQLLTVEPIKIVIGVHDSQNRLSMIAWTETG